MSDENIERTTHPWGAFLHARSRCLRWLRDVMHETPEGMCVTMSMDPEQVRSILAHVDAHPDEYAPYHKRGAPPKLGITPPPDRSY